MPVLIIEALTVDPEVDVYTGVQHTIDESSTVAGWRAHFGSCVGSAWTVFSCAVVLDDVLPCSSEVSRGLFYSAKLYEGAVIQLSFNSRIGLSCRRNISTQAIPSTQTRARLEQKTQTPRHCA